MLPLVAFSTAILVAVAIAGHIVIALMAPKEASASLDERERQLAVRAGHHSGLVFGAGVIPSLALYLFSYNGNLLFYCVFGSLMISQLVEYRPANCFCTGLPFDSGAPPADHEPRSRASGASC